MEILIVIAIIILLAILVFINLKNQIAKANDAKRKADLMRMQRALEEHYNDQTEYPAQSIFSECWGAAMQPYMQTVPCDPVTRTPYLYIPDATNLRKGYRICTKLENQSDPDIVSIGCSPTAGCGWEEGYNYCLAQGVTVTPPGYVAPTAGVGTPTPTHTPTPPQGVLACTPAGDCNSYHSQEEAEQKGCPWTYPIDSNCIWMGVNQCLDPANRCDQ